MSGVITNFKPKLRRWLTFHPVSFSGQQIVLIKDSIQICEEAVSVPRDLMPVLARFDGKSTVEEIASDFASHGYTVESIKSLLFTLDEYFLLENARSEEAQHQRRESYGALKKRPALFAGRGYPADRRELTEELRRISVHEDAALFQKPQGTNVVGLVSPHVDYARGARTLGGVSSILSSIEIQPDLLVLIGTAHEWSRNYFHLTRKDFSCPLGDFIVEKDLVKKISETYGENRCLSDEVLHQYEYSLELQLPLLSAKFPVNNRPQILPILIGSFDGFLRNSVEPAMDDEIADFLDILGWTLANYQQGGKSILLCTSANLTHVGVRFGDAYMISESHAKAARESDVRFLEGVLQVDPEALFFHLTTDGNRRRICGFSSLYSTIILLRKIFDGSKGVFVDYQQLVDPERESLSSLAALAWCR